MMFSFSLIASVPLYRRRLILSIKKHDRVIRRVFVNKTRGNRRKTGCARPLSPSCLAALFDPSSPSFPSGFLPGDTYTTDNNQQNEQNNDERITAADQTAHGGHLLGPVDGTIICVRPPKRPGQRPFLQAGTYFSFVPVSPHQPLRLKYRAMRTATVAISSRANGYPYRHFSSGINEKFMP